AVAVSAAAVLPDNHLVELDVRDRLGRGLGQGVQVFQHQQLERFLRPAAGLDDALQTVALLGQDFILALGLGFELGEDRLGLAFPLDAAFLGLGLGLDDDLGLLGFGRRFQGCPLFGFHALGLGQGSLGHGPVLGFLDGGLGLALAGFADLICLGLF